MNKTENLVEKKEIRQAVQKKVELVRKIREFRLEIAKINEDLVRAGADINAISAW